MIKQKLIEILWFYSKVMQLEIKTRHYWFQVLASFCLHYSYQGKKEKKKKRKTSHIVICRVYPWISPALLLILFSWTVLTSIKKNIWQKSDTISNCDLVLCCYLRKGNNGTFIADLSRNEWTQIINVYLSIFKNASAGLNYILPKRSKNKCLRTFKST